MKPSQTLLTKTESLEARNLPEDNYDTFSQQEKGILPYYFSCSSLLVSPNENQQSTGDKALRKQTEIIADSKRPEGKEDIKSILEGEEYLSDHTSKSQVY